MDNEKKVVDATDGTKHNKPATTFGVLSTGGNLITGYVSASDYETMLDRMERNEDAQKDGAGGSTTTSEEGT